MAHKRIHVLTVAMLIFFASIAINTTAQTLYGLDFQLYPHLWTLESATGNTQADLGEVLVSGYTVAGSRGMATDPTDGTLYAILYVADVQFPAIEGHLLVTINLNNAIGTEIAFMTQGIRDLTFDSYGNLFGISGGPNQSSIPDHLFAVDKATGALTDLAPVGTTGTNPRNHSIAFRPSDSNVIYHRYGSTGFETIALDPPYTLTEIGTNDIGMSINISMVYDTEVDVFRTAETPGGGGVPYYWVTIDESGLRTDTGIALPEVLMGLAFDQAGTVVDNLFVDGFETGDTSGWDSSAGE